MHTDNPCLSWTSFYPDQAPGIFRWPSQAERPLSGVRDQRDALHDPGGSKHGIALTVRLPLLRYEVRGLERSQGG